MNIVAKIEDYIKSYLSFEVPEVTLPLALWTIGTHCFRFFDSFAYVVITSKTKRAGKTRLSEIISFAASQPMNFSSMTPSTLFRVINPDPKKYYPPSDPFIPPTIIFDEAESLSSEAAGTMRSVLNAGYRKGQSVPRTIGQQVIQFQVYCPKVFILIGDVYDTLRDRSIIIDMKRGDSPKRFLYDEAQREGAVLRAEIKASLQAPAPDEIDSAYHNQRAQFLSDRDEEIWLPLFAICKTFAPNRLRELQRIAVDLSAMKTADKKAYKNLDLFESKSEQNEYAERAAIDLLAVINGEKAISTAEAVAKLRDLDLSPWRTYRGGGIDQHLLSDLLAGIGIPSVNVRFGKSVLKGYRKLDVQTVVETLSK
jgi:hypothetical protein